MLPAGALVVVLSTFLDDEAARVATLWRGGGHRVIAVDVLPPPAFEGLDERRGLAARLVLLERADRIRRLVAAGVEPLRWAAGDRDAVLRELLRPVRR